ncbi:transglutaminase-like domain-containing protein [Arthrobacter antibioticus]|uniref:transglutaminase-like domain-containing protein n=1 Tax=Arthrobacter sp. H35-MC1 TaxID=3046203 RepID=UPI0024BB849B|nr:transglutaminaseTgpA domain-containing protein [Arthrobacter sp. H35-MC1]MDJ0317094.1 transglutaminaseTgpA domain-containing protein [Arthrobacter sp. H35-MC1]
MSARRKAHPAVATRSPSASPSAFAGGRRWWHFLLDGAVLAILLGVAVVGFGPAFGHNPHYLVAGFGAIVLGLGVGALGAHWRLGLITMIGFGFVVYMVFGSALAAPGESILGFIPSLGSLRGLLLGIMLSWKQLLTLAPPVGTSVEVLVVPYLAAFVAAILTATLAWRLRNSYWAMIPVAVLFITAILFGTTEVFLPVLRGSLLAAGAIAWFAYRHEVLRRETAGAISANQQIQDKAATLTSLLRRIGMGAGVILVAGAVTMAAAPALTVSADRDVLRDTVIPPPDLHNLPSPLTKFRDYVKNEKDTALLTVKDLPKNGRVRLAAMDNYDGVVFNVDPNSSASFAPIGDPKSLNNGIAGTGTSVGVVVDGYSDVWIPTVSAAQSLSYESISGQSPNLYLNKASGTALNLAGVAKGDEYTMDVQLPSVDANKLAGSGFGSVPLPKLENVPPVVGTKANEIVGEVDTPLKKVQALESALQREGKFSNGLEGQTTSNSGHSAARITKMLSGKEMVGDDEQYATTMALMARHLGIPARVVMGFYLDEKDPNNGAGSVVVKGSDVHAWVEVNFAGVGWVPFNPTPDKDHIPNPPEPQNASKPKPQVLQPPPPPQEPADLPPDSAPDALDTDGKKNNQAGIFGTILMILGVAAIPIIIIALPLVLIVVLKTRRRKKRHSTGLPTDRVGGGWSEVLSLATDLGAEVGGNGTRRESAASLSSAFPASQASTALLAERADAAIFGPGQPSEEEVATYWQNVDHSVNGMTGSVGFWKRQRAKFSPRSLLAEAKVRAGKKARQRGLRSSEAANSSGVANSQGGAEKRSKLARFLKKS